MEHLVQNVGCKQNNQTMAGQPGLSLAVSISHTARMPCTVFNHYNQGQSRILMGDQDNANVPVEL